jgi:hypothetical protein
MAQDRIKHGTELNAPPTDGDSPYQTDYFGPERYEDYDSGEQVINHLMFYKSIISEEDSGQKISDYMELVRGLKEGEHLPIKDPFDKSIALTFELVMQNHMNPWDVDLLKFSNLYMDRMKAEQEVDFITAGRLMFMAWSVLKLQSDEVLAQSQPAVAAPAVDSGWDPGAAADWMQSDASVDFTTAVLNRPSRRASGAKARGRSRSSSWSARSRRPARRRSCRRCSRRSGASSACSGRARRRCASTR